MPYINGILGRICNDPKEFQTKSGKSIYQFTMANNIGYGDRAKVDFVRCIAFGKTGEIILSKYKKGDLIIVQGQFRNNPYKKDENGYILPNWQYVINSIVYLPNGKGSKNDNEQENEEEVDDLSFDEIDTSVDEFGNDKLPF